MLRTPLLTFFAGLLLWASPVAAQTTLDPYTSGMRWSDGAPISLPWIPRRVCFAGGGQAVWAGRAVGTPGAVLYTGTDAPSLATSLNLPFAGAIGVVEIAVGERLSELFVGVQFPGTNGRTVEISRMSAAANGPLLWTRVLGPEVAGGQKIAAANSKLYAARFDATGGRVWLDRLDPLDGQSLFSIQTPALALRGLAVSSDGERISLALGNRLVVFDATGANLLDVATSTSSEAFAMSTDGRSLAMGDKAQVNLWRDSGSGYLPVGNVVVGGDWLATRAALSADGLTLGVGWWDAKTGASIRIQMWDLAAGVVKHDIQQGGILGGLQNFPEAVVISADGRRMAVGTWGSGGPDPQLLLVDRELATPVYSTYLSGSVMALDLDDTGTRIAVASKAGHANQFSTTGFIQVFDTGERDLQLIGGVKAGAGFHLTSKLTGSTLSLFALGRPLVQREAILGVTGLVGLDVEQPLSVRAVPADSSGRADLLGLVPADPSLVGFEIAAQVVFVGPFGLELSDASPTLTVL